MRGLVHLLVILALLEALMLLKRRAIRGVTKLKSGCAVVGRMNLESIIRAWRRTDVTKLRTDLRGKFVDLGPPESQGFVDRCRSVPGWRFRAAEMLPLSMNDRHAVCGTNRMLALDRTGFQRIVGKVSSLLDVGAGTGETTREFPCDTVVATDASFFCWARLRSVVDRAIWSHDIPPEAFDLVVLLNVLDRAVRPQTLLRDATQRAPLLLVGLCSNATPFVQPQFLQPSLPTTPLESSFLNDLPYNLRQSSSSSGVVVDDPGVDDSSDVSFETFLAVASDSLVHATGFHLVRLARAPYISFAGKSPIDESPLFHTLDQALFLLLRR